MITVRGGFGGKGKGILTPTSKCTEYILTNNGSTLGSAGFSYTLCNGTLGSSKVNVGKPVNVCIETGTLVIPENGTAEEVGPCDGLAIIVNCIEVEFSVDPSFELPSARFTYSDCNDIPRDVIVEYGYPLITTVIDGSVLKSENGVITLLETKI